jgi:hypothetical protein
MEKDWGFAALIEYGGKRILFDTGDNPDIPANNANPRTCACLERARQKRVDYVSSLDHARLPESGRSRTSPLGHLRSFECVAQFAQERTVGRVARTSGSGASGNFPERSGLGEGPHVPDRRQL